MADTQTFQPDYDAIAQQAYEWLKKRRAKGEISTFEVLMKNNGYKWGDKELEQISELDLFEVHNRLLRLIKTEKKYVADFSACDDQCVGLPFNIPFVFRKIRASATVWHI